jgi:hypothetical protein
VRVPVAVLHSGAITALAELVTGDLYDWAFPQTLLQQIRPWLLSGVLGALSAAILGQMVIPGPTGTAEADARNDGPRPPP